jgi:thioredoxin-like negative regulator of GroEL
MYKDEPTLNVVVVDVDENQDMVDLYNITSIPTHIVMDKDGEVEAVIQGVLPEQNIKELLKER